MYLEHTLVVSELPGREDDSAPAVLPGLAAGGAFSRNTERAMRSDLAVFARWCGERGLRDLPAAPETVAAFVDAMAETRAPATVRRYVASIAAAHRVAGLERTLKGPQVRLAISRMHRKKGRRQGQAHGLTWPLRRLMTEAAGDRLIDDRDRALLAVAYDTMLRRAELVSLQVPDLLEGTGRDAVVFLIDPLRISRIVSCGIGCFFPRSSDIAGHSGTGCVSAACFPSRQLDGRSGDDPGVSRASLGGACHL